MLKPPEDSVAAEVGLVENNFYQVRSIVEAQTTLSAPEGISQIGRIFLGGRGEYSDCGEVEIGEKYRQRVRALLLDVQEYLLDRNLVAKILMVGGGDIQLLSDEDVQFDAEGAHSCYTLPILMSFKSLPDSISLLACSVRGSCSHMTAF